MAERSNNPSRPADAERDVALGRVAVALQATDEVERAGAIGSASASA